MSVSTSLLAYTDCIAYMDQALADQKGARIKVATVDEASHQRLRMHYARKLHREENAKTYEAGHKMHGRSEYDVLTIRIKNVNGAIYLYLERTDVVSTEIESLSNLAPQQIEHVPMKQIEPPKVWPTDYKDGAPKLNNIVQSVVRRRV